MPQIIDEPYGQLVIHESYLVFTANQGIDFSEREAKNFIHHVRNNFDNRPYSYISNRTVGYSINPIATQQIVESTNIKSIAIVVTSTRSELALGAELPFYEDVPVKTFGSLEEAVEWSLKIN